MKKVMFVLSILFTVGCSKIEVGSVMGTVTYTGASTKSSFLCYLYDAKISDDIISIVTQEHSAKMGYNFVYADNFDVVLRQLYSGYRRYLVTATGISFRFDDVKEGVYMLLIEHGTCYYFPNIPDSSSDSKVGGVEKDVTSRQYKLVTVSKNQPIVVDFSFEDFTSDIGPVNPADPAEPTP